jgi:hypothetical protein
MATTTTPKIDAFYATVEASIQKVIAPAVHAKRALHEVDHTEAQRVVAQALAEKGMQFKAAIAQHTAENRRRIQAINGFFPSSILSELLHGKRTLF